MPVLRAPGGRAAAYHQGCLVVEEFARHPQAMEGMQERFRERGAQYVAALHSLGVDARLGEVPDEYNLTVGGPEIGPVDFTAAWVSLDPRPGTPIVDLPAPAPPPAPIPRRRPGQRRP